MFWWRIQAVTLVVALILGIFALPIKASIDTDHIRWMNGLKVESNSLTSWPTSIQDGQDVTIYWRDIKDPTKNDFIGVTCGPSQNDGDFFLQNRVGDASGSGSLQFRGLFMMRCDYVFTYFRHNNTENSFTSVGQVTVRMRDSFNAPKHGHISLTSKDDEMAVMFNSASSRIPRVRYGTMSGKYTNEATGNSTTYSANDLCDAPANQLGQRLFRDPGYMHRVVLTKLESATRYFYIFGNDVDGWSKEVSFMSRPTLTTTSTKFIAYADMGCDATAGAALTTAVRVYQDVTAGYDGFLLHFGDISYALGDASTWDHFFYMIEPYATKVPYMIGIGNHEYDHTRGGEHDPSGAGDAGFHPSWGNFGNDSHGECAVPMYHRFSAPDNGNSIYWYSFNYGGVHVIQMSTEHDFTKGSTQYKWIEADLAGVDREVTPWVVLTGHRMMYTTQTQEDADLKVSYQFRREMEYLLIKYEVNVMMVGHQHNYERSCAVYQGVCREDGNAPVHFVVGSAGTGLEEGPFSNTIGNWSVAHVNDYGYLRIETTKETMHIQFVLTNTGDIFDEVTLKRWNFANSTIGDVYLDFTYEEII